MTAVLGALSDEVCALAAEFPGFSFGTQRTWGNRLTLVAERLDKTRPGVTVVLTPDPEEMRRELSEGRPGVSPADAGPAHG